MNFLKKAAFPVLLVLLAAGVQPSLAAFWQWSKTPATNATADQTINWAEGMSPSSVNDSARAMMARMAEYRDDISGSLTTAGTSTAYTVTTNQGLSATPADGVVLAITPNVTNDNGATLTADGGTAYPIQPSPGNAVSAGVLVAGTPYSMKFSAANSAWILRNFYANPYGIPLGGFLQSSISTPPNSSFIQPYGQCISTTTYSAYWIALGSPPPGTCSAGQFKVIDMRGRTMVALDNLGGTPANVMTNSDFGVAATSPGALSTTTGHVTLVKAHLPPYTPTGSVSSSASTTISILYFAPSLSGGGVQFNYFSPTSGGGYSGSGISASTSVSSTFSGTAQGGTSTPFSIVQPSAAVNVFLRVL